MDNYGKREKRKIKAIGKEYEKKISELNGASLTDASGDFKKELRYLMNKRIEINSRLREVKNKTGGKNKYELKYNPETDEATPFRAWQQAEAEKQLLADKYITNVNGHEIKTDADKILDLLNDLFASMDSTKVLVVRAIKDGHVKLYISDEDTIENQSEEEL